ncbi:peptidoglycan recognition protein 1 [Rhipicephalus sanguineus]|uniref:peptidoglycan recognition protein 1 n=1 Tax=Rhipicephalus sanguineus TaxID=34632 RepID=UPI0020C2772B|nr:peptidoglycan recognition protein 1 [Rhipicephalus sanguineus]
MVRKRFSIVHVLTTTMVIVAVVLDRASSGERKQTTGTATYGYPHWQQGIAGEWWRPWPIPDAMRVMLACSGIEFVPRQAWGARPPKAWERLKVQPVPRFFVHHTTETECFDFWSCSQRMRYWQNFHMDTRDWYDLGYSFLIGGDGRVYVARGWDATGAHTKGHNEDALSASFIGDFSRHLPTPRAIWALHRLLQCGVALGKIRADYTLHGHRDAACRVSPGDALYALLRHWKHYGGRLQKYVCEMKHKAYEKDVPTR